MRRNKSSIHGRMATGLIIAVLLGGCTVGQDFIRPAAPEVSSYTPEPLEGQTVSAPAPFGKSQRFVEGGPVNPQWWRELGAPRLDTLIDEALQNSPTLAASRATLRQAREIYTARSGSTLYPRVDANINA
ncbi:MAG: TolC family protein, partial [Desulfobulbaceae bacterium]|nr:TolC family protein [Desulfobulbaceae bacterium]